MPARTLLLLLVLAPAVVAAPVGDEGLVGDLTRSPAPLDVRLPAPTPEALLDACLEMPDRLEAFLPHLPHSPAAADRLIARYGEPDELRASGDLGLRALGAWMLLHDARYTDRLAVSAASAFDHAGAVVGEVFVRALAARAPERAEPVLETLAAGGDPATAALATALLFPRRPALRDRLVGLVEELNRPLAVRRVALEGLMGSAWKGRDAWFLGLLADESLRPVLPGPVRADPEPWIPRLAEFVRGPKTRKRDGAVACLAAFTGDAARADAARPILRWIDDPAFGPDAPKLRLGYFEALSRVDVIGAGARLAAFLGEAGEKDGFLLELAVAALVRNPDPAAVGPLREQFHEACMRVRDRRPFVEALVACGGLSPVEAADGVLAFLRNPPEPGDSPIFDPRFDVFAGWTLARPAGSSEAYARELVRRAAEFTPADRELRERLATVLAGWTAPTALRHAIAEIEAGRLPTEGIVALLGNASSVRASAENALRPLFDSGGARAGIAAALTGDGDLRRAVLEGADATARAALLAADRFTGFSLDPAAVGERLFDPEPLVRRAAKAWLVDEDGKVARRALLDRWPGEAHLVGRTLPETDFAKAEARLRAELFAAGGPDEVFALLASDGPAVVVRISAAGGTVGDGAGAKRDLTAAELAAFRARLERFGADALKPVDARGPYDRSLARALEYVHVTRTGGVRVVTSFPEWKLPAGLAHWRVSRLFRDL